MTFKKFIQDPSQVMKMIITLLFTIGSAFTTFNLFAFRGDQYGFYYKDANQYWLATGIILLVLGWFIRNWKKI